jgi:succinoglycan biosynthesis protein ExoM
VVGGEDTPMSAFVAVAICTYNRPVLLGRLIDEVGAIARADAPDRRVPIVVVDDSPDGSAREVVERASHAGADVHYTHSASGDISTARNTAVCAAAGLAPFVACVDDDCIPQPGWFAESFAVANEWNATIVVGHRQFVATDHSPRWLRDEPFLDENERYPDGSVPTVGNMANVLIRSSWFLDSGVRFRPDLGRLGGEDMVFFADAKASGAEIRFAARSVVLEPCDARRSTFRYQMWRQAWLGNNEAHISARTGDHGRVRLAVRGGRRILRGVAWPVVSFARTRRFQLRWAAALVASGAGLVAGACGVEMIHRS